MERKESTHPISRRRWKRSLRRRRQLWLVRRATVRSTCSLDYSLSLLATLNQFGNKEEALSLSLSLILVKSCSPIHRPRYLPLSTFISRPSTRPRSPRSWRVGTSRHASSAHHRNPSRTDAARYDGRAPDQFLREMFTDAP